MSEGEILDEDWAREGVAEIEKAIADYNAHIGGDEKVRILWGWASDSEKAYQTNPDWTLPIQGALIDWLGVHISLNLWLQERFDHSRGGKLYCKRLRIGAKFESPQRRTAFQLMTVPMSGLCRLIAFREGDLEPDEWLVHGVETEFAFDGLTWRVLHDEVCGLLDCFDIGGNLRFPGDGPPGDD